MSRRVQSPHALPALMAGAALGMSVLLAASGQSQPSPNADHMTEHFSQVGIIINAVIRGELEDVREPARWMASHQEGKGLPANAGLYVAEMRNTAKQTAQAKTLAGASIAAASMAVNCGACHAAAGVKAAVPEVPAAGATPASGIAKHMLEHQWAVDLMLHGLIRPSDEDWTAGARRLQAAPMSASELPDDPKLSGEIREFEAKVHALAEKALRASPGPARAAVFGEITASCGACHGLHGRVWGPGVPRL
jgi:cytochrome c553